MQFRTFLLAILVVVTSAFGMAQSGAPTYQKPPQAVVDVMDAPRLPGVAVSPLRDVMALVPRRSMPAIAELARPWLGLAGSRIDPANNGPRGAPDGTGITLRTIATGVELKVQVPADAQHRAGRFLTRRHTTRVHEYARHTHRAPHRRRRDGNEPHRRWRIEHGRGRVRLVDGQLRAAVPLRARPIAPLLQRRPPRHPVRTSRRTLDLRVRFPRSRICWRTRTTKRCSSITRRHNWPSSTRQQDAARRSAGRASSAARRHRMASTSSCRG